MATLLVVDRDDCYLPKGWVSTVLPDGLTPSEYETSGHLWKAVEVPAGAIEKVGLIEPGIKAMILGGGSIEVRESAREVLAARLATSVNLKPAPGPGHLDRSHSTVWDYGPGRTYSTPQAAFDALLAQEGSGEFTQTHYVRGWSGTYPQDVSAAVLGIHTVCPTARYPLVVDAEADERVIFDDEGGPLCIGGTGVNHVWIRSLTLMRASTGIMGQVYEEGPMVEGWLAEDCEFDGSESVIWIGACVYKMDLLRLRKCWFHHLSTAIAGMDAWPEDYATRLEVSGCLLNAVDFGIRTSSSITLVAVNNTIEAISSGIYHSRSVALTLAGMINNIFTAGQENFNCIQTEDLSPEEVRVMRSDGNCFYPGTNGFLAALSGTHLDLAGWRERFHQDDSSIAADPDLNDDFVPSDTSPCLGAGVFWDARGWSGVARCGSIDMGAEQVTRPRVPGVSARRRPEIGRRR